MPKRKTELTNTDKAIMDLFWNIAGKKELTAREVIDYFNAHNKGWSDRAVMVFLKDLRKKGLLHAEKKLGVYHYSAVMTEEEYELLPTKQLLQERYDGSYTSLLCALCRPSKITPETLELLKKILEDLDED